MPAIRVLIGIGAAALAIIAAIMGGMFQRPSTPARSRRYCQRREAAVAPALVADLDFLGRGLLSRVHHRG